jgi:predicted nucleic acid-binding protein
MALILDAGALIAIDRRDRRVGAMLRVAQRDGLTVRTSAAVVAQVWRDSARQASLAMVLRGVQILPVDEVAGKRIGELLGRTRSSDIVDGHVAVMAVTGDVVATSDAGDIQRLLDSRRIATVTVQV